jgi:hypothetical protein
MKLYLDDTRPPPSGWVLCRWPNEVIDHIKRGNVEEISLDHDLGDDKRGTGYDVLRWLEERVFNDPAFPVPVIHIHTGNPVARKKMAMAVHMINRRKNES